MIDGEVIANKDREIVIGQHCTDAMPCWVFGRLLVWLFSLSNASSKISMSLTELLMITSLETVFVGRSLPPSLPICPFDHVCSFIILSSLPMGTIILSTMQC